MTQKHVVIILCFILVIGLGIAGYDSLRVSSDKTSPNQTDMSNLKPISPTPDTFSKALPTPITPPPAKISLSPSPASTASAQIKRSYDQYPGDLSLAQRTNKKAVMDTSKGRIEIEIFPEATKSASNFIFLVNNKFYDGLTFHRVVLGFVIQGGDPQGNGTGGSGYEFNDDPVTRSYDKGIVAMANSGPNTNGSQFFIMLADNPDLPAKYSIFGKVIAGQTVVDKIQVGDLIKQVIIKPLK